MKKNISRIRKIIPIVIALAAMLFHACSEELSSDLSKESIIPAPASVIPSNQVFKLSPKTMVLINNNNLEPIAKYLTSFLKSNSGYEIPYKLTDKPKGKRNIFLKLNNSDSSLGNEGYELNISKKSLQISAFKPAGLFNGVQTLLQLLPVRNDSNIHELHIATGLIRDFPKYEYRGVMLDVSRHFFQVPDVKRFIDLMAFYKMNKLHLHLADDQGWRIEIKSWPKLTEIGGSTQVGGGNGGFYTQEEYKEIVAYAQERFITIIPEIDMPGHTNAALASYAELNCDNKATKLYTGTRVGFSSLCIDKDITYKFIDDVVGEIAALTPGPYFHLGGDESHSTKHDDFIYFINRVLKIVKKHGKIPIGWDEIAHADIDENTIIQYWSSNKNAKKGLAKGTQIIISPAAYAYLDMKYDSTTVLGLDWASLIEVDRAYQWNPDTMIHEINTKQIAGIECPLWSETVTNIDEIEYLVFPRLPGYAEIGWSQDSLRNWDTYKQRLAKHAIIFDAMDIDYYKSPKVPW